MIIYCKYVTDNAATSIEMMLLWNADTAVSHRIKLNDNDGRDVLWFWCLLSFFVRYIIICVCV